MTWFGQEQREAYSGGGTLARQRWDQLRRDSRQHVQVGEYYVLVLWPMSGWQIWKRIDKEWVEFRRDCASMEEAIELAGKMSKE